MPMMARRAGPCAGRALGRWRGGPAAGGGARAGRRRAALPTDKDAGDGAQVGPLLDQVDGPIASFTGDGAYDQEGVYAGVAERHPEAAVIVPPRTTAVPSKPAESAPAQ